eukprot:TRINITY_DN50159_c0_g1_i1.p1 TRINITY_DN50159_c0_g1~~TRINITY_DN50159_c0_g1_i1.p1  ORF type:complete len:520 (+),score=193.58 TRINITY_DN50159_c0_g1_i1:151-1560(+)
MPAVVLERLRDRCNAQPSVSPSRGLLRSGSSTSGSRTPPMAVPSTLSRTGSFGSLSDGDGQGEGQVPIWRIVLTGGPCGGKTTALSTIAERLRSLSLQVFTVPENATLFANAGAGFPATSHKAHQQTWETSRMICQMEMENAFIRVARSSGRPTAIICDRGVMDAKAYMDEPTWQKLLAEMGWEERRLRDERYDMVVHLVSTAIGAPQYYCNTVYRHENTAQAAELDHKIKRVWGAHPTRAEVDNSTGYDDKVARVVTTICRFIGVDAPGASTAVFRYTLKPSFAALRELPRPSEEHRTLLIFLQKSTPDNYQCIRMHRREGAAPTFVFGQKSTEMHTECPMTEKEFVALLGLHNQCRAALDMKKRVWVEGGHFYEASIHDAFMLLQIEVERSGPAASVEAPELPGWLRPHIAEDVTGNSEWDFFAISHRVVDAGAPRVAAEHAQLLSQHCLAGVDLEHVLPAAEHAAP